MARYKNRYSLFLILAFVLLVAAQSSSASVFVGEDQYVSAIGDTLNDDLYLGCEEAAIDGYVANDLSIGAKRYTMSGEVGGNLNSGSQFATIRGIVHHSARLFAQRVTIDGQIYENLIVMASDLEIGRSASIGRDAMIMGSDISISGTIGGDLIIRGDQVVISGKINGNVDIESNRITLLSPAEITGDFKYKSKKELKIDDDVVIGGEIEWIEVKSKEDDGDSDEDFGLPLWLSIVLFFPSLVTGLIVIGIFGHHSRTSTKMIIEAPLRTLGVGSVAVLISPLAILILLPTVIGTPTSLILMFVYTVFFYLSKIYVALAVGQLVLNRLFNKHPKQGWSFVLGLTIIAPLFWIPVIGWFVYLGTLCFGFGAILLGIRQCNRSHNDPANPDLLSTPQSPVEPPASQAPPAPPAT